MHEGFDAASALSGAKVAAAGRQFVCRYVGAYPGDWRATSAAELADLINHGVFPVLNYEGSGRDATSFANGVADARSAQARAVALGFPNAVIYFSVDEQWASDEVGYFQGVASVIGLNRTGVYGGWDTVNTVHKAGASTYYWMTEAWEFGRPVPSFVHIYQYANGQTVNGMSVDFDRALQDYYGQITAPTPDVVGPVTPFTPTFTPINEEDDMARSFISTGTQAVKFELGVNSKRSISKAEWDAIRAVEAAGGPKVAVGIVSQAILDAIPGK